MIVIRIVLAGILIFTPFKVFGSESQIKQLDVRLSWGYSSAANTPFFIQLNSDHVRIRDIGGWALESGEESTDRFWKTTAGGNDVDGVTFKIIYTAAPVIQNDQIHPFWKYLMEHSDSDTARRLNHDPSVRQDSRRICVQVNPEGTRGFCVTIDQLEQNQSFWIPELDLYLAVGENPISFACHQQSIETRNEKRVLQQVAHEPESSFKHFSDLWEDMGSPAYVHPNQPAPGHIVGLSWDSALYKFGIDRGAGVWNDYGNPDCFRFWFDFGELNDKLKETWKGQILEQGLPVITTTIEQNTSLFEIEQFAFPLNGVPDERKGGIPMVLFQKIRITNTDDHRQSVSFSIHHQRKLNSGHLPKLITTRTGDTILFHPDKDTITVFSIEGKNLVVESWETQDEKQDEQVCFDINFSISLDPQENRELIVKLPSPMVHAKERETLLALDYPEAKSKTIQFWSDYLNQGAQFQVPEQEINDLFRANLWHALRLPRRHGGEEENVKIDLPYSNFAYDQSGIPWPVNQAVYVDYMLYDLRGYHDISLEELLAMFQNNQEPNGHINGYANWGVYTPSMIYSVAQHFLLSQNQDDFEQLLPYTLKAMDWCLNEIGQAQQYMEETKGLIRAPLNDLTGDGIWAFTQAYIYAGLSTLGKALERIDHPRAQECLDAAHDFQQKVIHAFGSASTHSPLVQLRDHTWIPYVPCEVLSPQRLMEQWYPTDVDTGATHLLRLKAIPAEGLLADSLLNDHEDNLFLHGWGAANEPVYNPQATAYLLRDDVKATIRAFYTTMASAFSHSVYEPVEHRWFWGQYFGPPSTDGAWFELYRHMLIHELDDDTLLLLQATPRDWLMDGKRIEVKNAPTYYGQISFSVISHSNEGKITVEVDMPADYQPETLLIRLRHPTIQPMQTVTLNGADWRNYNVLKEWIVITNPTQPHYSITVIYER